MTVIQIQLENKITVCKLNSMQQSLVYLFNSTIHCTRYFNKQISNFQYIVLCTIVNSLKDRSIDLQLNNYSNLCITTTGASLIQLIRKYIQLNITGFIIVRNRLEARALCQVNHSLDSYLLFNWM